MGGIRLIVDSREQIPLEFKHQFIKEIITKGMSVGDYGCMFDDTFQVPIVFERKSLNDLYGTLSAGYDRFRREIDRAKEQNIQLIIIVEGHLSRVLLGVSHSKRTPESIVYQIFTILARHGVQTVFCRDRQDAAEYITQFYIGHYKEWKDRICQTPKSQCNTQQEDGENLKP